MRKSKLVLALSAMLPGVVFSAPPTGLAFDTDWSLNADGVTIDFVCPTGYTCGTTPIADSNFLQVQMTDGSGKTFFRTIISTNAGSDVFTSENFVASGVGSGGIAAKQTLNNTQAGSGTLKSSTVVNTGSFNNGTENQVTLSQGIWDPSASPTFYSGFNFTKNATGAQTTTKLDQQVVETDQFADSFNYEQSKTNGAVSSTSLDIVSGVNLNNNGAPTDQAFSYSYKQGNAVAGPGDATLPSGTVSWTAGQAVERVLVSQTVTDAGDFGYERVANLTTPTEVTDFSLAALAPLGTVTGTDPFGAGDPGAITVTPLVP